MRLHAPRIHPSELLKRVVSLKPGFHMSGKSQTD